MDNDTGLFLDGIFDENYTSPNKITVMFTEFTEGSQYKPLSMCGLLAQEPSFELQNKWGPLLETIGQDVNTFLNLMGNQNLASWIGASAMVWKGTEPLKTNIDFYLINYREGLQLEEKLKGLMKLATISQSTINNVLNNLTVTVHGGYSARQVLSGNKELFACNKVTNEDKTVFIRQGTQVLDNELGTLSVRIGNKMEITNLLLQRINITPSIAEVASGRALYYRVSMGIIGVRPLLSTDVDKMFISN